MSPDEIDPRISLKSRKEKAKAIDRLSVMTFQPNFEERFYESRPSATDTA